MWTWFNLASEMQKRLSRIASIALSSPLLIKVPFPDGWKYQITFVVVELYTISQLNIQLVFFLNADVAFDKRRVDGG